jgi:hypothetical protein
MKIKKGGLRVPIGPELKLVHRLQISPKLATNPSELERPVIVVVTEGITPFISK